MHVEESDHVWENVQRGSKDVADDHEVSSSSMLYPSHVHSQGKQVRYLQFSSLSFVCTVVYIIKQPLAKKMEQQNTSDDVSNLFIMSKNHFIAPQWPYTSTL